MELIYKVKLETGGVAPTELEAAHLKALFEKTVSDFNAIEGGATLKVTSVEEVGV